MSTEATPKLTPKQLLFCKEYLIDLNATQAAIRAGYSEKTAYSIGEENLKKPDLAKFIQDQMDKRAKKVDITAEYVLETIKKTVERCSQAEPVLINGEPSGEYKFDAANTLKGCELLGKHLKMFTDKTEITGKDGSPIQVQSTMKNMSDDDLATMQAIMEKAVKSAE